MRDRARRQVQSVVLASVAILVAVTALNLTIPPLAPRVNVRWARGVSDAERAALETRFQLASPAHVEASTWTYDLSDPSPATVGALVRHPAVEDTHGIDRRAGVVEADAPRGTRRTGSFPLGDWVASPLITWIGVCAFWTTLLSGAWLLFSRHTATRERTPSTRASTEPPA